MTIGILTPRRVRHAVRCALTLSLTMNVTVGVGTSDAASLETRVDPRVELLSIVFRLAGNPEYAMESSASPYADAVEEVFGPFREHPTVHMARELREARGISFDAVMSLAVHLDDDVAHPRPRTALDPRPPLLERRWTIDDAERFIEALSVFVSDTGFAGFVADHRELYAKAAAAFSPVVNARDYVGWFDRFFGSRPQGRFLVVIGMLNGWGNYGVSMRHQDGREEITPVIGVSTWDADGVPVAGAGITGTIVHEFCHAYTNALVDANASSLATAGDALFERNAEVMRRQAYGSGQTVLYESLVRAVVVHFMRAMDGDAAGERQARMEMASGFKWVKSLGELVAEYDVARATYETFDAFMPRVVAFFDDTVAHYDALVARFPRVISMTPANGAGDVDPDLNEIVVVFDRPMIDGSWSVTGGGPAFPTLVGEPHYDTGRRTFSVGIALAPGRTYRFGLNGGRYVGFSSADGYPLEPVEVTFTTAGG